MNYIKLFEEFIQNPQNVKYEVKEMTEDFKDFVESEGYEFSNPFGYTVEIANISYVVSKKKGLSGRPTKAELEKLKPKVEKFFSRWKERFEKTNNQLSITIEIGDSGQGFFIKIDAVIKGVKFFKWRTVKGSGKKLFHFSDAKNREFILKNGIVPTMNKKWTDARKDLATNKPSIYAMPAFDPNLNERVWKKMVYSLFEMPEEQSSEIGLFSILYFHKVEKTDNSREKHVYRECTLVPDKRYSFNSKDPKFKIETPWAIIFDDFDFSVVDDKRFQIEESKFIDTTGEFKFEDGKWSDSKTAAPSECYRVSITIDLWEIDLDKINHEWWADPFLAPESMGKEVPNYCKWLISYDGAIPAGAITLKQSLEQF